MCFQKVSTIPLTASLFCIDQPNAIPFTINRACALTVAMTICCLTPPPSTLFGFNESGREQEKAPIAILPPVSAVGYCTNKVIAWWTYHLQDLSEDETESSIEGTRATPTHNLAILTSKTKRKRSSLSVSSLDLYLKSALSMAFLSVTALAALTFQSSPVSLLPFGPLLSFKYCPFRRATPSMHCSFAIFLVYPPDQRQYDWYHAASSHIVPFGYACPSLNAGAVVTPKLTTLGTNLVPLSAVLSNATGACWSCHGNSGTFGIAFNTPNIIPSQIAICHWPFNPMTSLSCAPHQITVWGLVDGKANLKTFSWSWHSFTSAIERAPQSLSKEGVFLPLAKISFDITARSLHQAFLFMARLYHWVLTLVLLFLKFTVTGELM